MKKLRIVSKITAIVLVFAVLLSQALTVFAEIGELVPETETAGVTLVLPQTDRDILIPASAASASNRPQPALSSP